MTESSLSSYASADKSAYYSLFRGQDCAFDECRGAVARGLPAGWTSALTARLPLISRYDQGDGPVIERAVKALMDLTDYAANRGTITSLGSAANAVSASTVAVADPAKTPLWLRAQGIDRDEAMRPVLAQSAESAAMLALWAQGLRGEIAAPRDKDIAVVPVLLSRRQVGEVGTIRVFRVPDGPPGLFPDPSTMAITACDDAFRVAVRNAWAAKGMPAQTILWSIDAEASDAFHGESAGAAFALALDELRRRMGRLGRVRYRRFNNSYVISATLSGAQGQLRGVGGLAEKLDEAARAGKKHVVLSEQDRTTGSDGRSGGADGAARSGLEVIYAKTLNDAIAVTRRLNPMFVATLATSLVTLAALAIGGTVATDKIQAAEQQANAGKILSVVSSLQRLAQQTGTTTLPDLQAKAQDLITAYILAEQAGRPDLASQIVGSDLRMDPGVLSPLNADLGTIQGVYHGGQYSVVTSRKGKIMLADDTGSNILGTYTLAPGAEVITQPVVMALATAPYAADFATVSQVPFDALHGGTAATLDIFSATGKLTLIGRAPGFTSTRVRGLSYSPDGSRLVALSQTNAYFWDASHAIPRLTGSCALPDDGSAVPVSLFPDPKSSRPLVVYSDSGVRSLSSWNLNTVGAICGTAVVIKPWAGTLAKPDTSRLTPPPIITAGVDSSPSGGSSAVAMIAAITSGGRVKVRDLASGRVLTLPVSAPAVSVSGPYGDYVAVQVNSSGKTAVQVWNWRVTTGGKPKLEVTYPGVQFPGAFPGDHDLATSASGEIVDVLNSSKGEIYPIGFAGLRLESSMATAAGQASFAMLNSRTIAVYSVSNHRQATYLSLPSGYNLPGGSDNRFNSYMAISQDGRYVAMIVGPGEAPFSQTSLNGRKVIVWDVATGLSTDLTDRLGKSVSRHRPADVRFVPGSDDILVNYEDGTLARVRHTTIGWGVSDLLHASSAGINFGMETGPGGIYLIERRPNPNGPAVDHVLRLSYTGSVLRSWDFSALQIHAPAIAPLSDTGVLLIDIGGTAWRLRPGGSTGKPVDLNTQFVFEARQIPGTEHVLIAGRLNTQVYDLAHDVITSGTATGGSGAGPLVNFAITADGRYLLGSDVLFDRMGLAVLTSRGRLARLCELAGGTGMSRQQWAYYVGGITPYTDPCAQVLSVNREFTSLGEQADFSSPPLLVQTPTATTAVTLGATCAAPVPTGQASGVFTWRDVGGTEVICVSRTLKWVVPNAAGTSVHAGRVDGQDVLAITGKKAPSTGDPTDTAIDVLLPEAPATSFTALHGTVSVTSAGVAVTTSSPGALRIRDTLGPNQDGYWREQSAVPDGLA
jgi:hypothetical protein